ncbi:hypothetical protein ACLOJK_039977 [Asimina triloba]
MREMDGRDEKSKKGKPENGRIRRSIQLGADKDSEAWRQMTPDRTRDVHSIKRVRCHVISAVLFNSLIRRTISIHDQLLSVPALVTCDRRAARLTNPRQRGAKLDPPRGGRLHRRAVDGTQYRWLETTVDSTWRRAVGPWKSTESNERTDGIFSSWLAGWLAVVAVSQNSKARAAPRGPAAICWALMLTWKEGRRQKIVAVAGRRKVWGRQRNSSG